MEEVAEEVKILHTSAPLRELGPVLRGVIPQGPTAIQQQCQEELARRLNRCCLQTLDGVGVRRGRVGRS